MVTRPTNITIPFANSGSKRTIPTASQIGITDGQASFTDGFPPLTQTALVAGGVPPAGVDVNGIFNIVTQHLLLQNSGGRYRFDATLAAAIGGYDVGVVLQSDDGLNEYVNVYQGNTTNFNSYPAAIGVSWLPFAGKNSFIAPGIILIRPNSVVPSGYLECNGAAISRSSYASLFQKIGVLYGAGNGSTTFNLPDYRGYFLRGWAHGSGIDPDRASRTNRGDGTTGDYPGTKQAQMFRNHVHSYQFLNTESGPGAINKSNRLRYYGWRYSTPNNIAVTASGAGETRPININVMHVIKY